MKTSEITADYLLGHWKQGKLSHDWRGLTIKGKIEWLKACLHWSGLPRQRIRAFSYVIDGNQIQSRDDYYCLLGETFFGYRGYFGMSLDGWYDCFSEIYLYESNNDLVEKGAKVVLKNSDQIKEAVDEEYFVEIVKGFEEQGFEVELE